MKELILGQTSSGCGLQKYGMNRLSNLITEEASIIKKMVILAALVISFGSLSGVASAASEWKNMIFLNIPHMSTATEAKITGMGPFASVNPGSYSNPIAEKLIKTGKYDVFGESPWGLINLEYAIEAYKMSRQQSSAKAREDMAKFDKVCKELELLGFSDYRKQKMGQAMTSQAEIRKNLMASCYRIEGKVLSTERVGTMSLEVVLQIIDPFASTVMATHSFVGSGPSAATEKKEDIEKAKATLMGKLGNEIADWIDKEMTGKPLVSTIAAAQSDKIYLAAGLNYGITVGQRFNVFGNEVIRDPLTGKELISDGLKELAVIKVMEVKETASLGIVENGGSVIIKQGMLIRKAD